MGKLPDLDTSNVGFLAYWNAIDQGGVSDIDPSEVTSASNVTGYTLYDNGIEGTINLTKYATWPYDYPLWDFADITLREANFRAKEDGWVIVWIDDSDYFGQNGVNGASQGGIENSLETFTGQYDVVSWGCTEENNENRVGTKISLNQNRLERAVNELQAEFSNSGSISYSSSDVALTNYAFTSATTTTVMSATHSDGSLTVGFQYTNGTTMHYAVAAGYGHITDSGGASVAYDWGGTQFMYEQDNGPAHSFAHGTYDLVANDEVPNASTEYTGTASSARIATVQPTLITVWE
jgi:hypothetical protein